MSGFISVLATIEPKPEDGMNIVQGLCDESWTPFWLGIDAMVISKQGMFDAVGGALKKAMKHFNVEKLSDLEMLEIHGIRIAQPTRPDGARDYVIHIRKKATVQ